jgi:mono/diheme cytochrome c family protein
MPRWVRSTILFAALASLLPFAAIYKARHAHTPLPRVHLIQGMDNQARYKSQQVNPVFADTREARPYLPGTIARGHFDDDPARATGSRNGKFVDAFPMTVTSGVLARGQERFQIYCAPCHGLAGYGDGIVAVRAERSQEGTWVPPTSVHDATVLARPVGHLFNTITNGIRTMPAYGPQIPADDRWAIVAYVRALQLSRHAKASVLTAEERAKLVELAP